MDYYKIKYSSMDQFYGMISQKINGWYSQLNRIERSLNQFVEMESFQGNTADSIKTYIQEVHGILLAAIRQTLAEYQSRVLLYRSGYYSLEPNIYATMPQERMAYVRTRMGAEQKYIWEKSEAIGKVLSDISDLLSLSNPSYEDLTLTLYGIIHKINFYDTDIRSYETGAYKDAKGRLQELITSLQNTVTRYYNNTGEITGYQSGDHGRVSEVLDLYQRVNASMEYVQGKTDEIESASERLKEAYHQIQTDYEAACEARKDEGMSKMIMALGAIVVGTAAIILTAGAATPIVVTAAVSGSCSIAYGVSNFYEGAEDFYYGSIGDLSTKALNPIRDTVFMGNQSAYDAWGSLSMTIAGLCTPVKGAVNHVAGKGGCEIAKTVIVTVGKELIKDKVIDRGSEIAVDGIASKVDLNQSEKVLLTMGMSFLGDKAADGMGSFVNKKTGNIQADFVEGMSYDDAACYNRYMDECMSGTHNPHPGMAEAELRKWKLAEQKNADHINISKVGPQLTDLRLREIKLRDMRAVETSAGGKGSKVEGGAVPKTGVGNTDISIENFTAKDVPTVKNGEFNEFFNSLSVDELDALWSKPEIRDVIEARLRSPGGLHEWHLVSRTPQFKYWDISAEQIKDLRTLTSEVEFVNPSGVHGGRGSTAAHNELLKIIDTSNDYDTFVRRLNNWANYRLKGGVEALPEGLQIK